MAILLSDLISATQNQYRLEVLAGGDQLSVPVSWVHLVEDAAVAPYFWGGELVITTGVSQSGEDWLITLAQGLLDWQVSGIIVNSGRYIQEISPAVIAFYNEHHLPLIAMPWEIHLSEVIKDYCMRIVMGGQNDAAIARAILQAIESPAQEDSYLPALSGYYNTEGTFQTIAFRLDFPEGTEVNRRLQAADILRTLLGRTVEKFSFLRHEKFYLLVLNDAPEALAEEAVQQIIQRCARHTPPLPVHIGIGTQVAGARNMVHSYRRARAAGRMADYFNLRLVRYREMGIYQLLFTAEDPDVLGEYCQDCLGVLEEYDRRHDGCLVETLYYDLLLGGSIKEMAAAMYTHRNTVNYRMRKVRSLLGTDLNDADERTRYRMAFYIKDILEKQAKKYERKEGPSLRGPHSHE